MAPDAEFRALEAEFLGQAHGLEAGGGEELGGLAGRGGLSACGGQWEWQVPDGNVEKQLTCSAGHGPRLHRLLNLYEIIYEVNHGTVFRPSGRISCHSQTQPG